MEYPGVAAAAVMRIYSEPQARNPYIERILMKKCNSDSSLRSECMGRQLYCFT